ncbi:MAG: TIGR00159 family protein [Firmicutes bacterium HGW-Firmicutes-1]|nr:MAG: TIGR00159 family protein [Firmicutes bacterium HGW-Firmicutes-1]
MIAFVIYQVIKWVEGTRVWMLVKGISVLFTIAIIAMIFQLNTILWIFANTISVGITALLIVFQPELRKALEQLGRKNLFASINIFEEQRDRAEKLTIDIIEELLKAVNEMSKAKTGALIVVEQDIRLDEYERTGIHIDAIVSKQMIVNIFEHNTPLHDGAVIIRHNRIVAATCYLPLSENMTLSKELGTRHRAAVGLTEVTDSIIIVVSEETGHISMALGGNLIRNVDTEYLKNKLVYVQKKIVDVNKFKIWKGRHKHDKKDNE